MLVLVTGDSGSGKTSQLLQVSQSARAQGIAVAGIICPAVYEEGAKVGIDALLLPGSRTLRLADRFPDEGIGQGTAWNFDRTVFSVINKHLEALAASKVLGASKASGGHEGREAFGDQILFIDEIGPQELVYGKGMTSALDILDKRLYAHALVVVRPSLLDESQKRWSGACVFNVPEEKETLASMLIECIQGIPSDIASIQGDTVISQ